MRLISRHSIPVHKGEHRQNRTKLSWIHFGSGIIIGLVWPCCREDVCCPSLIFSLFQAQSGSCYRQLKKFKYLCPHDSRKRNRSSRHVEIGYPSHFVGRGSKREIDLSIKGSLTGGHLWRSGVCRILLDMTPWCPGG